MSIDDPRTDILIKHNRSNKTIVLALLAVKKGESAGVKISAFSILLLKWYVVVVIIIKIVHRTAKSFICAWIGQGGTSEGIIVCGLIHFGVKLKRRIKFL